MIQLELLGSIELTSEGGEALEGPLRRSKRVALLAYLAAARPRGFQRRDKVAAVFWPELPSDRARAALRTTLTRLRDDLGADLILGRGADEISVDPTLIRCDAVEFDAAIESARFEEAVRLHRGPFLDGVHVEGAGEELEEWIGSERSRLRDGLLRALGALSNAAEKRGDLDDALMAAQRALDVSPNDEIVARRVIALLIAVGNRGSAMRVYDELVRRLSAEFGVEPAAETRALIVPLRERSVADKTSMPSTLPSDTGQARETNRASVAATMSARSHRTYLVALLASVGALAAVSWIALRGNGANAMPATPLLEWQPIAFLAPGPGGSFGSRAVLDSTGDALLVFGGVKDVDHKSIVPLGAGSLAHRPMPRTTLS
jgi:DNA-binding SARP family transcriptional activator